MMREIIIILRIANAGRIDTGWQIIYDPMQLRFVYSIDFSVFIRTCTDLLRKGACYPKKHGILYEIKHI